MDMDIRQARRILMCAICLGTAILAGCGGGSGSSATAAPAATSQVGGSVMGGRQPVVGATVIVYAAGVATGSKPQQIGSATTDSGGFFTISGFSPTPANGQLIYVAAYGGQPTSGVTNPQAVFFTVAGTYGSGGFSASVYMNELTTMASAYVLRDYLQEVSCSSITGNTLSGGECPSIAGSSTLAAASGGIANLVSVGGGTASSNLTGSSSPSTAYTAYTRLDSLGSVLAGCVNSSGGASGDGSACGNLFNVAYAPTGTLNSGVVSSVADSNAPGGMALSPDGTHLFVSECAQAGSCAGDIKTFLVNSNGSLTSLHSLGDANSPYGLAVSPNGNYLYVADVSDIGVYSIDSSGQLTFVTSVTDSNNPNALAVSADGNFLYVGTAASGLEIYTVGSSGASLSYSTVKFTSEGYYNLALFPGGNYLFAADTGGNLITYVVNGSSVSQSSSIADSNGPNGLAVSPNGTYLFVTENAGDIASYSISPTGTLTATGSSVTDTHTPSAIAASLNGKYVYVADSAADIATYGVVQSNPTDTLQAALNISNSANSSLGSQLFSQLPSPPVYSPNVTSAPSNWALSP